ncbi:MAG: PaaI family thioesterase [Proteobacteria bacterium]|nr:PaaI family thioesterase [Pseudomonadota bacterium]
MTLQNIWRKLREYGGLITALQIDGGLEEGVMTARMPIERMHTGAPGIAHGGSLMALLDSTLGGVALTHALANGRATSTVEMKVNFLRPAPEGETVVARAKLQSAGKSLLVVTGTAEIESTGEPVAFAVGTFNLYALEKLPQFAS